MNCRYLTFNDRKGLATMYEQGAELSSIACSLGVHLATVYRELARGSTGELDKNGRSGYNAELAQTAVTQSLKHRGRKTSNTNKTE